MRTDNPKTIYLKDYRPPEVLVDRVDLSFDLQDEYTQVDSRLELRRNPACQQENPSLHLDGEQLELQSLRLDGTELTPQRYRLETGALILPGLVQITHTRPCRRMIRHFSHIFLVEGRTFIFTLHLRRADPAAAIEHPAP